MYEGQVFLGKWEEVSSQHASELNGHRVEIRILDDAASTDQPRMIYEGMFSQLAEISEADFKAAEWLAPKGSEI